MILSTHLNALALCFTFALAAHTGRYYGQPVSQSHNPRSDYGARGAVEAHVGSILLARFDLDSSGLPTIIERRDAEGKSCPRCLERCPNGKVVNKEDCNRCSSCPPGQGADRTYQHCVPNGAPDRAQDSNNAKPNEKKKGPPSSREERVQAFNSMVERMKVKWVDRANDRAGKAAQDEQDAKDKLKAIQQDEQNERLRRSKARRSARCLAIVPLAMSIAEMDEYGDNAFDEDFLENEIDELAALIPDGIDISILEDDNGDEKWESEEYLQEWARFADKKYKWSNMGTCGNTACQYYPRRSLPDDENRSIIPRDQQNENEKRWFFFIVPALLRTGAALSGLARALGGPVRAFRVAAGGGGRLSKGAMRDAARFIRQADKWDDCVLGNKP